MEVKLDKRYDVPASVAQCWAVLSDIRAVAQCMPGAQITDQVDDTHFKGTVKSKVGPAVMTFNGDIEVKGLDPAKMALDMTGKGADKSGSSASMNLAAHVEPGATPDSAVLVGLATIQVSGKLAQFGSRLIVPVSDAMLAQFADNFRAAAAAAPGAATAAAPADAAAAAPEAATATATATATSVQPSAPPAATPTPASAPLAPPVKELNALALLWAVVKGWFAGLFGKKA